MTVVLRILGPAGVAAMPVPGAYYVKSLDVDANDGRGSVVTTSNLDEAVRFADAGAALEFWQRQSTVRPVRPDGKPNRPLTSYHVEVAPLAEGPV